jgi:bacteriocin-like protein
MKTINEFFTAEENFRVLTIAELKSVKGGDVPPGEQPDPFIKKK